jgi:arylformamidase
MRNIWDISRPLTKDLAPWPGDTPFRYKLTWRLSRRCPVNVGALHTSAHNGTHADAPFHFDGKGAAIDSIPLENYIGPAVVIDLVGKFSTSQPSIAISDLKHAQAQIAETRRVLLKTNCLPHSTRFPDWIPVLKSEAIAWLNDLSVVLLGVDVPSVDPIEAKALANHRALAARGIAIIESLDLGKVEAGVYEFVALPLKIVGGDAAPVRALLWRD